MKGDIRKIVVNQAEYIYRVSDKYDPETGLNTLTVKVFLKGVKRTPLIICFLTEEDYRVGQRLNKNVRLLHKPTNSEEWVNLNEPGYIRRLIELGIEQGWNGTNNIEIQNGMTYLTELGYDVSEMEAEVERRLQTKRMRS